MEKISIIIPCFNAENTILRTLNSVREQDYKDLEIILVNYGSTDETLSILNRYKEIDERFIVITTKNNGFASACNEGLKASTGKYIMFLTTFNNYTSPYSLSIMMKGLKRGLNADMCICNYDSNYFKSDYRYKTYFLNRMFDVKSFIQQDVAYIWNRLIKRTCITENFQENVVCEDKIFLYQNLKNVRKVVTIADSLINCFKDEVGSENYLKNSLNSDVLNKVYSALDTINSRFVKSIAKIDIKKELQFYYRLNSFLIAVNNFFYAENEGDFKEFCKKYLKEVLKELPANGLNLTEINEENLTQFAKLISYSINEIKTYNKDISTYLVSCFILSKIFFTVSTKLDLADFLTIPYQKKKIKEITYVNNLFELNSLNLI